MRKVKKNTRKIYYALYSGKIPILDEEGNPTFEYKQGYLEPVEIHEYVSAGKSDSSESPFGSDVQYDRVITLYDMNTKIDEHTRFWIDKEPEKNADNTTNFESANYETSAPLLDGLNVIQIATKKRKTDT